MSDVTIYHNPACGTSRNTLALIRNSGEEPEVIEYLKTPPTREVLAGLIRRMSIPVRNVLRKKGTPYEELGLGNPSLTDDQLLDAMMAHPILINRPIVVTPLGTSCAGPPRRCWTSCRSRSGAPSPRRTVRRSSTSKAAA
jgi:arsenate reductase